MTNLLLLGFLPSGSEWIIIALVILLLFGGKKIPELMRGLGKGVKSFKDGVNEAKEEINKAKDEIDAPADSAKLRRVLFRVIGVWFVLAIGYFIAMPYLFDHIILAPCHNDFVFYDLLRYIGQKFDLTDEFFTQEFKVTLVNINLAAPFFIHISTAFWMSVVTAMPYIFFEVWRFINPALYPNERKGVRKALTIGTGMFFIGVLMGYFMVYPLTLRFLSTYQLSSEVENILSLNSYIDNFMMLILCMGLAFELPLVTWLLSLLGVVNKSFLRKYRRHAVVIIVIAAAIITPTGDPFTLSVVAIPLYLLYEMSILMIKDKKEVPELEEEEEEGVAKV